MPEANRIPSSSTAGIGGEPGAGGTGFGGGESLDRDGSDRLGATDDCGFRPFSIDRKPRRGSLDFAREVAMREIRARMASEKLGI